MHFHPVPLSLVLAFATLAFACGGDDDAPSQSSEDSSTTHEASTGSPPADASTAESSSSGGAPSIDELASCEEVDLDVIPFMGPAFDPETGELLAPLPPSHIVATTVGWVASQEQWEQLGPQTMSAMEDAFQREGLLGASFGTSIECGAARTITLWRDEAALMGFVLGDAHMAAIQNGLQHTIGWETTHWTETTSEAPPTWDIARTKLDEARQ